MIKLEDLSKIARVSKATVSLALNDKPGISDTKREEIKRLAKEYNYIPLRKSRKNIKEIDGQKFYYIRFIACTNDSFVTNNFQSLPFFSELLQDMSNLSKEFPISLIINSVSLETFEEEIKDLEKSQKSDGIILLGTSLSEDFIDKFIGIFPSTVVIDSCYPGSSHDYISINNFRGTYMATKYLIENGHTKIGYIKGKPSIPNFIQRFHGYLNAMNKFKINVNESYIYEFPGNEIHLDTQKINTNNLPSAFICDNDYIAISLIKILHKMGLSVPRDVSVVGFDNISESLVITPELTTIEVNSKSIAKLSIERIIQKIENKNHISSQTLVDNSLIIRMSTRNI